MKINIETKNVSNSEMASQYFAKRLNDRFENFAFITKVNLSLSMDKSEDYHAGISLFPKNGNVLFAKAKNHVQRSAFESCIEKIESQIDKYKGSHFHK